MTSYNIAVAAGKSSAEITNCSIGTCPADWRGRHVLELHFEITDRLRASSSWWAS